MSAKRDHTEPLVLEALTVAEPSFKKSPVISMVKRPYIQFLQDWNEKNKQDIFKMQAERYWKRSSSHLKRKMISLPRALCISLKKTVLC